MIVEVNLPDEWPPGLAMATAQLMRQALRDGFPVVTAIRSDVTADQVSALYARVRTLIEESGLAA
jgi:hypothetical protein